MAVDPPLLSICMIVKNEEPVLGRALASAAGMGAELVVIDTGSTDSTVAIAEAAGAAVHHFPWIDDFSAARNFAFGKATGTWMLVLDADEEITAETHASFERVLRGSTAAALRIPQTSLDALGNGETTMSARFVRNGQGYAYEGRVHENVLENIGRAGGRIDDIHELSLVHHGYTAAETARKDRRGRNRALLEAAMATSPDDPRYWHYLAAELVGIGDMAGAATLFDRVLTRAPEHELAAWSASALASIHEGDLEPGLAWETAHLGTTGRVGRIASLILVGRLALRDGDPDTARACAEAIESAPGDGFVDHKTSLESAAELRAGALVAKEPGLPKTRDHVLAAVQRFPRSATLGDLLVTSCEAIEGKGKGAFDAVRRSAAAVTVTAAAMKAYFRGGAIERCAEIGAKSGVRSEEWAFAIARMGRLDEARTELFTFGDSAAPHAVVFGLAHEDAAAIEHGLAAATPAHREAFARVRAGAKVPATLVWTVTAWLELAIALREDGAAERLAAALPWTPAARSAFRARITHDAIDPIAGLKLALDHPTEPAASEVIGLVAHGQGDLVAAAAMLGIRARAGDAPVRVYLKAADALLRLGRRDEAAAMLASGREARPHARALFAPPTAVKPVKKGARYSAHS